jgi:Mlc titration factor MtfA (ptsG expression regulator)
MADEQTQQWLEKNVSLYRRMPEELRGDLLEMIPAFIRQVQWEGKAGQDITEEMKACIAAEACIPVLRLKVGLKIYRKLTRVEVFPKDLSPIDWPGAAGCATDTVVKLGWYWSEIGMNDGQDGYNLVVHEFAHVIDFASLDGKADGVPPFDSYSESREWEKFVAQNFEDFQRETGKDNESVSDYGSSNEAEFFACATESFYERGARFKQEWPEIYDRLKDFYGVDPLLWRDDPVKPSEAEEEVTEEPAEEVSEEPEPDAPIPTVGTQEESPLLDVNVDERGLGNIIEYHENGKRAGHWELRDHIYDGPWRRWNDKGEQIEEGWCRKGVRDGKYQINHPNGNKRAEGVYRNDLRDGVWKLFRENGELKQENHYQQGDLLRWEVWQTKDKSKKFGAWD